LGSLSRHSNPALAPAWEAQYFMELQSALARLGFATYDRPIHDSFSHSFASRYLLSARVSQPHHHLVQLESISRFSQILWSRYQLFSIVMKFEPSITICLAVECVPLPFAPRIPKLWTWVRPNDARQSIYKYFRLS
jgi:hypothetical protein